MTDSTAAAPRRLVDMIPAKKPHPKCLSCALPTDVQAQIEEGRSMDNPIPYPTISQWLKEEFGKEIGTSALLQHVRNGHFSESN